MDSYELYERQEQSARHHVRWLKAFYTSLVVGAVFLILPRAVPWFSSGMPEAIMGRPATWIRDFSIEPFLLVAVLHMLMAICYGMILAMCVYRFEVRTAVVVGCLVAAALYGLNFVLFRMVLGMPTPNETPVALTHLSFGLIFSAGYKAVSVPDAARFKNS